MKGIAHFVSGIAAATFIPAAVQAAAHGSFLLTLTGVCALLPDTLDFKLWRYFERPDVVIDPGAEIDPDGIARQIAGAIDSVYATGKPARVRFHTVRLGLDLWRQYTLCFNTDRGEVAVRVGPAVSTALVPYPGSVPDPPPQAVVKVAPKLKYTYDAEIQVDAFDGPSFSFAPEADAVSIVFLPWHRQWSHSLVVALGVGVLAGVLFGGLAGLCAGVGWAMHVLVDQAGAMGANLWWPVTRRRTPGLNLVRSGDPVPNAFTVWLSCVAILFNLDRFSDAPRLTGSYLAVALLLPAAALIAWYWRCRRALPVDQARRLDLAAELQKVEVE